jgi:hypothetical protein
MEMSTIVDAEMIVLDLSLSLLWYSIVNVDLSIVENNLFLYCSHLNMHTCISIYIRTTYKLPTIESTCVLLWESNFFFFEQYVSKALKKGKEWVNCISNWSDSWRKCIATWNSSCILLIPFSYCSWWLTEGEQLSYIRLQENYRDPSLMRHKGTKLMRWNVYVSFFFFFHSFILFFFCSSHQSSTLSSSSFHLVNF